MLSRVFKRPPVQGIYYYPEQDLDCQAAADSPVCGKEKLDEVGESKQKYLPTDEEIDRWIRKGYQKGKAEAEARYQELLQEATQRLNQVKEEANQYLQEAKRKSREILAASETNMVELALAVAEKLIKDRLKVEPRAVLNLVRESMGSLPEEEGVAVYLNPQDLPACLAEFERIEPGKERRIKEFLPDENLSRGSCRVESESGTVEYLLDEEVKKLRTTLLEMASTEEKAGLEERETAYDKH
ncbi:MAG: hypothetical protein GX973_02415 [Firmicutes bacterium]|nr:hypothetical protein [Bacillota bacterium]